MNGAYAASRLSEVIPTRQVRPRDAAIKATAILPRSGRSTVLMRPVVHNCAAYPKVKVKRAWLTHAPGVQ